MHTRIADQVAARLRAAPGEMKSPHSFRWGLPSAFTWAALRLVMAQLKGLVSNRHQSNGGCSCLPAHQEVFDDGVVVLEEQFGLGEGFT